MPFIVQCPHQACKKFMLLEDSARGSRVPCLVCKRQIDVDSSASSENARAPKPSAAPQTSSGDSLPAKREKVVKCPDCEAPLRVPPAHAGKPLKCPRCEKVFRP